MFTMNEVIHIAELSSSSTQSKEAADIRHQPCFVGMIYFDRKTSTSESAERERESESESMTDVNVGSHKISQSPYYHPTISISYRLHHGSS